MSVPANENTCLGVYAAHWGETCVGHMLLVFIELLLVAYTFPVMCLAVHLSCGNSFFRFPSGRAEGVPRFFPLPLSPVPPTYTDPLLSTKLLSYGHPIPGQPQKPGTR